jgi:peptidoglycan/xylan/chitin deacetylase (PgdA/CDA1 family)
MQIIADLTGKVPRFFRPPYGNIDNRVRAIAKVHP